MSKFFLYQWHRHGQSPYASSSRMSIMATRRSCTASTGSRRLRGPGIVAALFGSPACRSAPLTAASATPPAIRHCPISRRCASRRQSSCWRRRRARSARLAARSATATSHRPPAVPAALRHDARRLPWSFSRRALSGGRPRRDERPCSEWALKVFIIVALKGVLDASRRIHAGHRLSFAPSWGHGGTSRDGCARANTDVLMVTPDSRASVQEGHCAAGTGRNIASSVVGVA